MPYNQLGNFRSNSRARLSLSMVSRIFLRSTSSSFTIQSRLRKLSSGSSDAVRDIKRICLVRFIGNFWVAVKELNLNYSNPDI